jgi:pyruvate ferredoxin oxidoreductase gamma subunit
MIEIRFHGRGGQGAKIASRILGRSGFLAGVHAQDFAIFGAERRGAPVVSCTRLDEQPIETRGHIEAPSLVVVMDHSLLKEAPEQVFQGVAATTPLFVNGSAESLAVVTRDLPAANFIFVDLTSVCWRIIGQPFVSAAAAAAAAKSIAPISLQVLLEAAQIEFADFGMAPELISKNKAAAREIYALAPALVLRHSQSGEAKPIPTLEAIAHLNGVQFISPAIRRRGSAVLRHTGSWRMEWPEIELGKCKRCFLCYLYCPEAAIQLDSENYPHVDYDHCKGCLICFTECPTQAIARRVEH